MIGETISDYPDSKHRDARNRRRMLDKLPMIILQNGTPSRHINGVGIGIVNKDRDLKLNSLSRFEPSPKGIDISTKGSARGLDLPGTITTLKGLNT